MDVFGFMCSPGFLNLHIYVSCQIMGCFWSFLQNISSSIFSVLLSHFLGLDTNVSFFRLVAKIFFFSLLHCSDLLNSFNLSSNSTITFSVISTHH